MSVGPDDPGRPDVLRLLERHLDLMHTLSPPEDVHALDVAGLLVPEATFVSCRDDGTLVGVGALLHLDDRAAELKSMHVDAAARGRGGGRSLLTYLLELARARGYLHVSLETGTQPAFAAARALYTGAGFVACGPFGSYAASPGSTFLTISL